jgi:hypothetical protein
MIGYLAVVSLILLVQVGAVGAETEVVVYSDDNYLPYAYKEGGQARGIYTEILKRPSPGWTALKCASRPSPGNAE